MPQLKYGLNPDVSARMEFVDDDPPILILNGAPSYVNVLDALGAWSLVSEVHSALGRTCAASFKHVSPAGVAVDGPVDEVAEALWVPSGLTTSELSPASRAYIRARDCDPRASYGDFIAVSSKVDRSLADVLSKVVSDGIIAPGYEPDALRALKKKKGGRYLVVEAKRDRPLKGHQIREVLGVRLIQSTDETPITDDLLGLRSRRLKASVREDILLGLVSCRYAQSNAIVLSAGGMALSIAAGQQSRIACTRLAAHKLRVWALRRCMPIRGMIFSHELTRQDRINWQTRVIEGDLTPIERRELAKVCHNVPAEDLATLSVEEFVGDVCLCSDGFIPFRDNIDYAAQYGVKHVAEPGGSTRTPSVIEACGELGIEHIETGLRLFRH